MEDNIEKTNLDYINLHINNGGISLKIEKEIIEYDIEKTHHRSEIPLLTISANHFGIQTNNIKIPFRPDNLKN